SACGRKSASVNTGSRSPSMKSASPCLTARNQTSQVPDLHGKILILLPSVESPPNPLTFQWLRVINTAPDHSNRKSIMSRRCELTGTCAQYGNNVSHSNRKTRRRFQPNVQHISLR